MTELALSILNLIATTLWVSACLIVFRRLAKRISQLELVIAVIRSSLNQK